MLRCPALDRIMSVDIELKASIGYTKEALEYHRREVETSSGCEHAIGGAGTAFLRREVGLETVSLSDRAHETRSLALVEDDALLRPDLPSADAQPALDHLRPVSAQRRRIGEVGAPHPGPLWKTMGQVTNKKASWLLRLHQDGTID